MIAATMMAGGLAALAGLGAAQLTGPLSLGWPGKAGELVARIALLSRKRPSHRAKAIGAALIGLVLVGGALTAYAAAPAAPRRVAQVIRTRQVTPLVMATSLALNPTPVEQVGPDLAASQSPAAPSTDQAASSADMTPEEVQRLAVMKDRLEAFYAAYKTDMSARAAKAGLGEIRISVNPSDDLAIFGADAPEYVRLTDKALAVANRKAVEAYDRYGPVTLNVPLGANEMALTAAYPDAYFTRTHMADLSTDLTITAKPRQPVYTMEEAANPKPLSIAILYLSTMREGPPPPA